MSLKDISRWYDDLVQIRVQQSYGMINGKAVSNRVFTNHICPVGESKHKSIVTELVNVDKPTKSLQRKYNSIEKKLNKAMDEMVRRDKENLLTKEELKEAEFQGVFDGL